VSSQTQSSPRSTSLTPGDTSFFGHPRGLATLFFTEFGERFSYYGMRALLILFMTAGVSSGGLGFDDAKAGAIYGLYTSMVYFASVPGGWVADRVLGLRRAVLYGGLLIMIGQFAMAVHDIRFFYAGLCLVVMGTGLLKANISVIVGQLYAPEDQRRDAAFSIFYMGINLGAFVSPLVCGYIGQRIDWRLGFGAAGVGMAIGVVQYLLGQRHLGTAGLPSAETGKGMPPLAWAVVAFVAVLAVLMFTGTIPVTAQGLANAGGVFLLAVVIGLFGWMVTTRGWTAQERRRIFGIIVLFLAAMIFWSVFEQAGSTLNLFAQRSTRTELFGFNFPASWLQSVNSIFIITLAPVFAWLWIRLGRNDPSTPAKFALGLICAGLGFALLIGGAIIAETGVKVSPFWLVGVFFFHTVGELCLSPVGLSAMTRLAPARVAGLMMGVWFLSLANGNYIGGRLAALYQSLPLPVLLGSVAAVAIIAGLIMAALVRPIKRLM
jgi:POT family proton-dependent oligopeptide transporter